MQTTTPFDKLIVSDQAGIILCWDGIIRQFHKHDKPELEVYQENLLDITIKLIFNGCVSSQNYLQLINQYSHYCINYNVKISEYFRTTYFKALNLIYKANETK